MVFPELGGCIFAANSLEDLLSSGMLICELSSYGALVLFTLIDFIFLYALAAS